MKIFVLVACVLIVATVAYGADPQEVAKFHKFVDECAKELNVPKDPPSAKLYACVGQKQGTVLDEEGMPVVDHIINYLEKVISDPDNFKKASEIARNCITGAKSKGGSTEEKAMQLIDCTLPIVPLIDSA